MAKKELLDIEAERTGYEIINEWRKQTGNRLEVDYSDMADTLKKYIVNLFEKEVYQNGVKNFDEWAIRELVDNNLNLLKHDINKKKIEPILDYGAGTLRSVVDDAATIKDEEDIQLAKQYRTNKTDSFIQQADEEFDIRNMYERRMEDAVQDVIGHLSRQNGNDDRNIYEKTSDIRRGMMVFIQRDAFDIIQNTMKNSKEMYFNTYDKARKKIFNVIDKSIEKNLQERDNQEGIDQKEEYNNKNKEKLEDRFI